jgi:trk system potassium uptake protein TrkA
MKIIIAGAGEVGFHLAELLSYESQDITLIDTNADSLDYANDHLDIKTLKGNATSISVLREAEVKGTDLVIGVTSIETTNITICVLAKQLGAKRTIARISNTEFMENRAEIGFRRFGIDELISPKALAIKEIGMLLDQSAFNETSEFDGGALTMVGLNITHDAPFLGKTVQEAASIFPQLHFMPIALERFETQATLIPRGDTRFEEGDQVYFITVKGGVEELYKLLGKTEERIKNVMILGGGEIGFGTAQSLCGKGFNVKIIEKNHDRAFGLADELPKALVIEGDCRDSKLLESENIQEMDAFIAVSESSETNIIACLMAKSKGVRKTIALIENIDYHQLSQSIGINTLINKKILAANSIFRHIRKGDVVAIEKLHHMEAELLEFNVKPTSKACNKKIIDLDIPRSAIIGGVIRDGKGMIALGGFKIEARDRILFCCLPRAISRVEKLFM